MSVSMYLQIHIHKDVSRNMKYMFLFLKYSLCGTGDLPFPLILKDTSLLHVEIRHQYILFGREAGLEGVCGDQRAAVGRGWGSLGVGGEEPGPGGGASS